MIKKFINFFKERFKRKERDWDERPIYVSDGVNRPVDHPYIPMSSEPVTQLAAKYIEEFGEDKRVHFLASILATQNPVWRDFDHTTSDIIYGAIKSLDIGINKEYEDINSNYRTGISLENGLYTIINELLKTKNYPIDQGDILANLAGIGIAIYNQSIGGLIKLENENKL